MSVKLVTIYWSNYDSGISKTLVRGLLQVDTLADLPGPDDITGYRLTIGTEADIIDTAARYKMDSSGTWYVQEQGTDFYTKAQIDSMLSPLITEPQAIATVYGLGEEIPTGTPNLDGYMTPGIYYSNTAITPVSDAFRLEVKQIAVSGTGALQQDVYPLNPNGYYYTRVYYSNTWQPWRKIATFGVVGSYIPDGENILDTSRTIGRYYKTSGINTLTGLPAGFSSAFYLDVVNTVGSNRKHITLYPATAALSGSFYTNLETGSGFGTWYKFDGTPV